MGMTDREWLEQQDLTAFHDESLRKAKVIREKILERYMEDILEQIAKFIFYAGMNEEDARVKALQSFQDQLKAHPANTTEGNYD